MLLGQKVAQVRVSDDLRPETLQTGLASDFQERLDDKSQGGDNWRDSGQHREMATGAVRVSTPSCSSCEVAPKTKLRKQYTQVVSYGYY